MDIKGKKILFLGDSITEGVGTSSNDKRYFELIGKRTGAICKGYGISGTRISRKKEPSPKPSYDRWFNSRVDDMDDNADIVVVFGGTNDYGHGDGVIGDIDSLDEYTFYGALNVLFTHLKEKYQDALIVVLTPIHRDSEEPMINQFGYKISLSLSGYVDIIKEVSDKHGLTVFDFYNELGIDPSINKDKEKYVPDGLHPSDLGNEKMAEFIINKFKEL